MNEDVKRWLDIAAYDKATAEAMYKSGRYLYVLFMCQQAVEKTLKGLIVHKTGLVKLAPLTEIEIAPAHQEFLRELTPFYDETRYPKDFGKIKSMFDKKTALIYLRKTKEVLRMLVEEVHIGPNFI